MGNVDNEKGFALGRDSEIEWLSIRGIACSEADRSYTSRVRNVRGSLGRTAGGRPSPHQAGYFRVTSFSTNSE
jgi:hypothetical protein